MKPKTKQDPLTPERKLKDAARMGYTSYLNGLARIQNNDVRGMLARAIVNGDATAINALDDELQENPEGVEFLELVKQEIRNLRVLAARSETRMVVKHRGGPKVTQITDLHPKMTKKGYVIPHPYRACDVTVVEGESITFVCRDTRTGDGIYARTFVMGEQAEGDSYNLSYFGPIVGITDKTVTIDLRRENLVRLDLFSFIDRNYDFDLAKARNRNANYMD